MAAVELAAAVATVATAAKVAPVPAEGMAEPRDPVGVGLARLAPAVQAGPVEPVGPAASPVVEGQVVEPTAPACQAAVVRTAPAAIRGLAALEVAGGASGAGAPGTGGAPGSAGGSGGAGGNGGGRKPARRQHEGGQLKSRWRNVAVAGAVLVAGLVGLFLPVSAFDGGTSTVGCGNAVVAEQSSAGAANHVADTRSSRCRSGGSPARLSRRLRLGGIRSTTLGDSIGDRRRRRDSRGSRHPWSS